MVAWVHLNQPWPMGKLHLVVVAVQGRHGVGLPRDVFQNVVIFLEVCMPSSCLTVQVSRRFPVLEVGMVHVDDEGGFCPAKVVSPVG